MLYILVFVYQCYLSPPLQVRNESAENFFMVCVEWLRLKKIHVDGEEDYQLPDELVDIIRSTSVGTAISVSFPSFGLETPLLWDAKSAECLNSKGCMTCECSPRAGAE